MNPKHIKSSQDLVTGRKFVGEGFLAQAGKKQEAAAPFIERAKQFQDALSGVSSVDDLLKLKEFKNEIIAAAGFSAKSQGKFSEKEILVAEKKIFEKLYAESKDSFRDEVLYRYLLIKGDSLGGSMRNLTGASSGEKLTAAILEALNAKSISHETEKTASGKIKKIEWDANILLFDVKPKFINKNIDLILLQKAEPTVDEKKLLETPRAFLACGELKGGIDPAGADEHWKTANSAFDRIRASFRSNPPKLFYVGAAIEASMASEIFKQLSDGKLAHAANLNNAIQVADLAQWLVSL